MSATSPLPQARPETDASASQSSLSWLGSGGPAASSAIALYARAGAEFEAKLAATVASLRQAAADHPNQVVQSTSLGVEDMVLTDLIARHDLPIAVATLDTGALHPQTLALMDRLRTHYAHAHGGQGIGLEVYRPQQEAVLHFVRDHGERAMYESVALRKACCGLRKLEPLARMLNGRQAWITGLRREQSANRGEMQAQEFDDQGRRKYNPLIEWTWGEVWHYVQLHQVPYNDLHDHFMPSIGCAPCTRAIAVGEDFRAGRWWWESDDAKECGLHVHQS